VRVITVSDLFSTIRRAARKSPVRAEGIAGLSRDAFHDIERGRGISEATAQKLIGVARRLVASDVVLIVDGKGKRHVSDDFVERALAEIGILKTDNAQLRRRLFARFLTAL
jgi:hypothetical protein